SKIHLEADGAQLRVTGPDDLLTDDVVAALITDKVVLQMLVDVLGPVTVISARTPPVWPPRGGVRPAWGRGAPPRPPMRLPRQQVVGWRVERFSGEAATAACQTCTLTQTTSAASEAIFDTGPWQTCSRCGGRRWRSTLDGDECAACGPPPGRESVAITWVRA